MRTIRQAVALLILGAALLPRPVRAGEVEIEFPSSLDGSPQRALAYVPDACREKDSPLLVVAHPMGGGRGSAKAIGYHEEAERRGWLVVCPELHGRRTGGATSLASLEAQRDIVDAVDSMAARFRVDRSRVYLAGRSMGGMLAATVAAKYPDRFACVVAGQGIYDLAAWSRTAPAGILDLVRKECLELSDATAFDYARRSAISYAPNFAFVPLILWHGTNDALVLPGQSESLVAAVLPHYPRQEPVSWLHGAGHMPINFPPRWICDRMEHYVNTCDGRMRERTRFYPALTLVVDEPRSIFWLSIDPAGENVFARVSAAIGNGLLAVSCARTRRVAVDVDKLTAGTTFSRVSVVSDGATDVVVRRGAEVLCCVAGGTEKKEVVVPPEVWAQPKPARR